jgi:hypothetical protein
MQSAPQRRDADLTSMAAVDMRIKMFPFVQQKIAIKKEEFLD